ncbi:histidine phosphatase family protein [Lichenicoccus sp.]|uniref:histidine phosphatase family protein n=1 Tax=Lichenicoccus sp. TaxID=2781899 RepID=UPI003D09B5DD
MTTIVLLRHPRPALPEAGLCYGRLDPELRPGWQAEIDALTLPVLRDALLWTSPSRRCAAPARRLAARLGLQVRVDERLQELDFGDWEGLSWDQVPRAALDLWAGDLLAFAPPGGETGAALVERVGRFHGMLRADARSAIVVSHGGPLRVLSPLLRDVPVDLAAPAMDFLAGQALTLASSRVLKNPRTMQSL